MAKKQPPNVAEDLIKFNVNVEEQLKKFEANISNEDIDETPVVKVKGFQKKEAPLEHLVVTDIPNMEQVPFEKISKDALIEKVLQISSIQIGLRNEIIDAITNDADVQSIREKILQIHTFDVRLVDEILMNL